MTSVLECYREESGNAKLQKTQSKCSVQVLQNGAPTAGYTVTAPGYAGGSAGTAAPMRLDECQRGILLNAASATSDVTSDALYASEVVLPAAAATVTPVVSAGDDAQRHALQVYRQVRSFV